MDVRIHDKSVPVHFSPGVLASCAHPAQILGSSLFTDYCAKLDHQFIIRSILIQAVTIFGSLATGPRIGFIKLTADIVDGADNMISGTAFLRGGSVVILVILRFNGEDYTVIVKQPRSPIGNIAFPELPAGMLDGSGHFVGKAAAELREELAIDITESELIDMTELAYGDVYPGVFASPGASDEFFRIMLYQKDVDSFEEYHDRQTGLVAEGEVITTEVIPFCLLWLKAPDAKTLVSLALYRELKALGKI